ncbi:DUF7311 family protein [Halorubrum sp. DTA98]|uniref:DUF7311 family protein n=1 Tax=Halorubrum sp. DTA98 TaxID=3402163 RepID=UPI003AB074C4
MIRVVLTVLVAVALLGTALPALDDARTTTTIDRLDTQGDRLERAVSTVAADSVAVDDPTLAARATVTVRAPTGVTAARIDRLALGDPSAILDGRARTVDGAREPADDTRRRTIRDGGLPDVALVYRLADGPSRVVSLDPSTNAASLRVVDGPIELRTNGRSRIQLRLVAEDGAPTVRAVRVR